MIARMWRGRTPAVKADEYVDYVQKTGVKAQTAIPGNRGD